MSTVEEIQQIVKPEEIDTTFQQLNKLELEIIGMKYGYFFPTPESVCQRLIELADVQPKLKTFFENCRTNYQIFNDEPTRFLYQDMLMSAD